MDTARAATGIAADLALREPGLSTLAPPAIALSESDTPLDGSAVTLFLGPTPRFWFDATRLSQADAQALADRITRLVAAITDAGPDADLTTLTALTNEESARLSGALAATARDYDRALTIPAAMLRTATAKPDHTAVIAGTARLSYADLAKRAARIANVLRSMGVARGTLVGLSLHRGADMIAGALGIQMHDGMVLAQRRPRLHRSDDTGKLDEMAVVGTAQQLTSCNVFRLWEAGVPDHFE
jgi:non-ribosomal peptide synthetase component F